MVGQGCRVKRRYMHPEEKVEASLEGGEIWTILILKTQKGTIWLPVDFECVEAFYFLTGSMKGWCAIEGWQVNQMLCYHKGDKVEVYES